MKKKMYRISLFYILFGLVTGVVYREVSYRTGFTGTSMMSVVHPHAIILGGLIFLLLPVLMKNVASERKKSFQRFMWTYNTGLIITLGCMVARGMSQLLIKPFPGFVDHMVSGVAGIGHSILAIGICFLFYNLIKSAESENN